jgi:23S rRNA pseudouridine1911/1915/1917 synthase
LKTEFERTGEYIGTADAPADASADNPDSIGDDVCELEPAVVRSLVATDRESGLRLDKAMAQLVPDWSRVRLRGAIERGEATLNGAPAQPRAVVVAGDRIELAASPLPEQLAFRPEPIDLEIVYEDDAILVLNKQHGLVVHPAAGNWSGTLLNGLLAHDARLAQLPRAGIVHRLDADTSGLMVVARTEAAQLALVRQLQAHSVTREYWAIVHGTAPATGRIDAAITRDHRNPRRFAVVRDNGGRENGASGRAAVTHFRRAATGVFDGRPLTWLVCRLETGRTHQIRVHLESIGHPLVGDPVYRNRRPAGAAPGVLTRQALHASRLELIHPASGAAMSWFAPPPVDLAALMAACGWGPLDAPAAVFQ